MCCKRIGNRLLLGSAACNRWPMRPAPEFSNTPAGDESLPTEIHCRAPAPIPASAPRFSHQRTHSRNRSALFEATVPGGAEGWPRGFDHVVFEMPSWLELSLDEGRAPASAPEIRFARAAD